MEVPLPEAPQLSVELIQDTLSQEWKIVYGYPEESDTVNTGITGYCTLVDTVTWMKKAYQKLFLALSLAKFTLE